MLNENPVGFGLPFLFGDGGLGDVIISSNTTVSAFDIREYRNLTVDSTFTLSTTETTVAVMILYVAEMLSVSGTIDMDADGGDGGAAVAGGSDAVGLDATDYSTSYGGSGGGGGATNSASPGGGDGGDTKATGGAGGASGNVPGAAGAAITNANTAELRLLQDVRDDAVLVSWGSGGGSGAVETAATNSGKGGDGGGVILIFAQEIVVASGGVITADGEDGGAASGGDAAGGGGGGGGLIYIVSRSITNNGSIAAAAGAGGAGTGAGTGGAAGAGTVILEEIP